MRKWFSAAAAAVMAFSVLCACGGGTEAVAVPPETAYECTVINSFENWQRDIDPLIVYHRLGRMELTDDTTKITDGSRALAVTPIIAEDGLKSITTTPSYSMERLGLPGFKQRLEIVKNGVNETDLTRAVRITADVYNEYGTATELRIYVDFGDRSIWKTMELAPNTWTKVDFPLDPAELAAHYTTSDAVYIRFEFETVTDVQTVYFDNLRLYRTADAVQPNTTVYTDGAFLDFSDPAHKLCVYPFTEKHFYEDCLPSLEITGDYADIIGRDTSALAIHVPALSVKQDQRSIGGIDVWEETLIANGFTSKRGEDRFSFALYNDSPSEQVFSIEIYRATGAFFTEVHRIPAYGTLVFDKSFAELNLDVGAGNTEQQGTGSATQFRISWQMFDGSDAVFVLYDMRLTEAQA